MTNCEAKEVTFTSVSFEALVMVIQSRMERLGLNYQGMSDQMGGVSLNKVFKLVKGKHTYPLEVLDDLARQLKFRSVVHMLRKVAKVAAQADGKEANIEAAKGGQKSSADVSRPMGVSPETKAAAARAMKEVKARRAARKQK